MYGGKSATVVYITPKNTGSFWKSLLYTNTEFLKGSLNSLKLNVRFCKQCALIIYTGKHTLFKEVI